MKKLNLIIIILISQGCASVYYDIEPANINYESKSYVDNVKFEYKYDLLRKKYKKKEANNGIKLIAVRLTNNSNRDLIFGQDIKITNENNNEINIIPNQLLYKSIKQGSAIYLLYLLLTPTRLYSSSSSSSGYSNRDNSDSFPIGFILGPGIAAGNIIASSSYNKNFKTELDAYDLMNKTIKKGESKIGLVGISAKSYESLKIKIAH